ncbi:unnamed protein product [Phytophthora fragariaefolia]|uniref:Unnamed protein product n=1 Tax=Phytophthora fragariaefolia TaxID=1490495 RepID=A0A9W6X1N6_9STRA|nr:unnamed protein product [Phytophthora fragariaefolia]
MIRQAVWSELSNKLAWPVNPTTIQQVVRDKVAFLQAMGLKVTEHPSSSTLECWIPADAAVEFWKWKNRLCSAFGLTKFSGSKEQRFSRSGH